MVNFLSAIKNEPLIRGDLQKVSAGTVRFNSAISADKVTSKDVCENPFEVVLLTQTTLKVEFVATCYISDNKWRSQQEWVQETLGAELRRAVYGEIVEDLLKIRSEIYNVFGMCSGTDNVVNMLLQTVGKMQGR